MSYFRIPKATIVPLNVLLADGNASKFPVTYLYKDNFSQVAGSPFSLTSVGNGLYSNLTVSVPEGRYIAVNVVYNDAGHTNASNTYGRSMDVFDVTDIVDVNAISEGVWRETLSGNIPAGSFGDALAAIGGQAGNVLASKNNTDTLLSRLTATRAAGLDYLDTSVASLPGKVWDEARAAHTSAGSFGEALDAPISSREPETAASSRALIDEAQHAATQAAIAAVSGTVGSAHTDVLHIKAKTDNLSFSGGNVLARAAVVDDKTGFQLSSTGVGAVTTGVWSTDLGGQAAGQLLQDAASTADPAALAEAVWDEARAAHTSAGSFGEALQGVLSTDRATRIDYLDASVNSRLSVGDASLMHAASMGEHADTQAAVSAVAAATGSIASDVLAVKADTLYIGTPVSGSIASNLASARTEIAGVQADTDNIQSRIGSPFTTVTGDVQAVKLLVQDVKAKSDQMTFTGTNINAHTKILDDKAGFSITSAQITEIVDKVWDETLASHATPGSAGESLSVASTGTNPATVASAVWDELSSSHVAGGSFGGLVAAIRHAEVDILAELGDNVYGLDRIHSAVVNEAAATRSEISISETKIDNIIPAVVSGDASLAGSISSVAGGVASLSAQLAVAKNDIVDEVNQNEAKIDALAGTVSTLTNNTTARFIVPERMILPSLGTKSYMFYLRLFDEHGMPENPDSAPTIVIKNTSTDMVLETASMVAEFGKPGCFEYEFPIHSSYTQTTVLVEASVIKDGVTRYLPAVSEITEFESDLTAVSAQLATVDSKVSNTYSQITSGVHGLSALRSGQLSLAGDIAGVEAGLGILSSEVQAIPTDSASSVEVGAVLAAVSTKPSTAQVQSIVDYARTAIQGVDVRDLTQVYDNMDLSAVVKTNDPRLNNLDVPVSTRSTLAAGQVWSYGTRALTEEQPLLVSDVERIWNHLVSQIAVPGSIGEHLVAALDAAVSTRSTASDVSGFLSGVAQESTLGGVSSVLGSFRAESAVRDGGIAASLAAVLAKVGLLPSDPASQSAILGGLSLIASGLANVDLKATAIRAKTDNLPATPAQESSVYAAAAPLLRADDTRLNRLSNLDQPVSSVVAPDISGLATTAQLHVTHVDLADKVTQNQMTTNDVKLLSQQVKAKTDTIPLSPASTQDVIAARNDVMDSIQDIPSGMTPLDVWTHTARTITQDPTTFGPDVSNLATKSDVLSIPAALVQHTNRMSTVFNPANGKQEVIVWAERNGQRVADSENCYLEVYNSLGELKWNSSIGGPNLHGIYRFESPISVPISQNYYIVIRVDVDGTSRTSIQAFFTVV